MKIPEGRILPTLFMGNYFCLIPNTKLAFVVISKNGVTFLKRIAIYQATGKWNESFRETHNLVGYNEQSPYLVPVSQMRNYEQKYGTFIKFAVWRDPIERITSTYKLFCLEKEYHTYFHYLGLYENSSFSRFMEFLKFEWKKSNPIYQDEHIRRQVDYYHPSSVDYIVPITKLNNFLMEQRVELAQEISNKTHSNFTIDNPKYINQIRKYYEADYSISCNYVESI